MGNQIHLLSYWGLFSFKYSGKGGSLLKQREKMTEIIDQLKSTKRVLIEQRDYDDNSFTLFCIVLHRFMRLLRTKG